MMGSRERNSAKRSKLWESDLRNENDNVNYEDEDHRLRKEKLREFKPHIPPAWYKEVIHKICESSGEVQRIVIFRKRGVQAMVEFDCIESARQAMTSLNGADIYSGCCTLRIEWAKPAKLNVYINNNETWDYTGALDGNSKESAQPALLGDAPSDYGFGRDFSRSHRGMSPRSLAPRPRGDMRGRRMLPPPDSMMRMGHPQRLGIPEYGSRGEYASEAGYSRSPVLMVYGLHHEKMNCDRLFNILCLYGNVIKVSMYLKRRIEKVLYRHVRKVLHEKTEQKYILLKRPYDSPYRLFHPFWDRQKVKFLKSKPGTAMVQMGDPAAVDRAIANLSGAVFFEEKLSLAASKQMYLNETGAVGELSDGTPSQVDYTSSRNNRFTTTQQAAKNRIQKPSKALHYFNAPLDFDEEKINEICNEFSLDPVATFTPFKSRSEKSSTGLLEFDTKAQAMEALTMINHYKLDNPNGRFPYVVKLCFSTAPSTRREER